MLMTSKFHAYDTYMYMYRNPSPKLPAG